MGGEPGTPTRGGVFESRVHHRASRDARHPARVLMRVSGQRVHRGVGFASEPAGVWLPPGVPSLTLFPLFALTSPFAFGTMSRGATSANRDPVRLSTQRGWPPACHRRGRSPPRYLRATAPMVRRWRASQREAKQKAGAPGRHQTRTIPAYRNAPLSLGHANPATTRLMGRRDARPHNGATLVSLPTGGEAEGRGSRSVTGTEIRGSEQGQRSAAVSRNSNQGQQPGTATRDSEQRQESVSAIDPAPEFAYSGSEL